ncbi:3-oxoacyl-[acyl-carrier-protein] synthase [Pseudoscourfieldia marina]
MTAVTPSHALGFGGKPLVVGRVSSGHRGRNKVILASSLGNPGEEARRVVVTGLGVVSCFGNDVAHFHQALCEGRSGISMIERFDTEGFPTRFAGEIKDFSSGGLMNVRMERRADNCIRYLMTAGRSALIDAGLDKEHNPDAHEKLDKAKAGVLIGSAMGGIKTLSQSIEILNEVGHRKMNPFCIPFAISNMGGALLAIETGFEGPNYPINTACASANYCYLNAADHIKRGEADIMLAGGTEAAIESSGIGGFIACKALSSRNDDPQGASRPWDINRDGFVMGEGAGILVLEEYEHAVARGARIYAELIGGAVTCDAHHMTEPRPDGSGVSRCISMAVEKASIDRDAISLVNAHATSTPAGDMAEYRAITNALPGKHLKIHGTKSMTGHLLGAAAGIEGVASVMAVHTGEIHPTINVDDPEPAVDMSLIPTTMVKQEVHAALSNSFGFGGHNSSVIFGKVGLGRH